MNRRSLLRSLPVTVLGLSGCLVRQGPSATETPTDRHHESKITPPPCPQIPEDLDNETVAEFAERVERFTTLSTVPEQVELLQDVEFARLGPAEVVDRRDGAFVVHLVSSYRYAFYQDDEATGTALGRSTVYVEYIISPEAVRRSASTEGYDEIEGTYETISC